MRFSVEQMINLPGMKVLNCHEIEGIGLIIEIEKMAKSCTCRKCGYQTSSIHQNHWRIVQDLPISDRQVQLKINRRQFRCKKCQKIFSEELDFIEKNRGYTKRLAADIIKQVLDSNIRSVALRNDLTDEEIESMLNAQAILIESIDFARVKRIGIDEIALVKGQGNYLAIIVDLDTNKPIEILRSALRSSASLSRRSEELRKVFEGWGYAVLEQIHEVSIDLWNPYKNLVEELMPNVDVTADRFHVMKQITDELDTARKSEKRAAEKILNKPEKERKLTGITKSKYSLLKNEKDLTEQQKEKLKSVLEVSPQLSKMHALKEEFRYIFETKYSWGEGVLKLLDWMHNAMSFFPKSIGTIQRWFGEIVGYFDNRTTSGVVEGINNKLKLIKRLGYGFRNFENFKLRSLLTWHFGINYP
ncbi:MAG: ISL3 family transposase [Nostoc sp.]|uniref:ISL3 family transposase n=1 Tax=Nostoc sp. TaxID=1180 RepID=UPI002FFB8ADD